MGGFTAGQMADPDTHMFTNELNTYPNAINHQEP